uniref:Integrin alpha-2 domain-containing protein n=1 Tax=Salarias fasciatus TaxID=181472 RepID=A0A672HJS6_SALFA
MCVFRCVCVLLCVSVCVCLRLFDEAVRFSGLTGSLFGFSVDFHTVGNASFLVIGAPKCNTSQSGVVEGGGVFICPLSPGGGACDIIDFDPKGDEVSRSSGLVFHSVKSHQWFGASVRSVGGSRLLACAPLFHWNVQRGAAESGRTPVGNCLLLDLGTKSSTLFSPCRADLMEEDYKRISYANDRRYCEVGFSTDVTQDGRLVFGAPGSFFFQGQVITVEVSDIISSGRSHVPIPQVSGISQSYERGGYDVYHGESSGFTVAFSQTSSRPVARLCLLQVASYFGHSVAVTDVNGDGRHTSFSSQPDQSLIGPSLYGRFGSALAALGDLDMDGYQDIAIGAPWAGESGRGQVLIYLGNVKGLSATPSQVIDSPSPSARTAFGFTLRSGSDIDGNGYPDLIVGAWAADQVFVYRYESQVVIRSTVSVLVMPDFLNPDIKLCHHGNTAVSCFTVQMCVGASGHRIPQETALKVELQLDKMKQPMARRTLLLSTNQPQEVIKVMVLRDVGVACVNRTAYLKEQVQDKLSPIFITVNMSLLNTTQHALLDGQTQAAVQTRMVLDCGDDNICVPDLKLNAELVFLHPSVLRVPPLVLSKNPVNGSSNQVNLRVRVEAEAQLEIRGGSSPPDVVLPLPDWQPAVHPGSLGEVGPLVEHVYELRNQGPGSVNARLTVDFPSSWRRRLLLYMFSNASEESLSCRTLNASQIDPFKLVGDVSNVPAVSRLVQQEETNTQRQTVHVNCSSTEAGCVRFVCDVMALGRGSSAVIRVSARLWTHTLNQDPNLNFQLVSSASYSVINTTSKVQPLLLDRGQAQTQLSVAWRPDGEKDVPIGYMVLSVVCGLLLLCLLCCIFWKLGFFKRIRPPSGDDADDDDDGDEEQPLAEESHDLS